jgi:glycosyltransferase involved in cell wall biosynthesis
MDLTIIVPAHNEEKYIAKCLENIPKGFETIVICNACTDKTEEIAKKYTDKVFTLKEKGVARARNFGAKEASNNKLVFIDADIQINEKILRKIKNTKYTIGGIYQKPDVNNLFSNIYTTVKNIKAHLMKRVGGVIFCNKSLFLEAGKFPEDISYREDVIFTKKATRLGHFGIIKEKGIVSMRRFEKTGYIKHIFLVPKSWKNEKIDYPIIR